jgi:hypothetical protein
MKKVILMIALAAIFFQVPAEEKNKRYRTVEGKIVGIWPDFLRYENQNTVKDLKEKWGFNYIFLMPDPQYLENVLMHYKRENILCGFIESNLYNDTIYNNMWAYYLDEPFTAHKKGEVTEAAAEWSKQNNSLFITGDYKRNNWFVNYAKNSADIVMFTSYKRWDQFLFWWIPGRNDQRSSWRDMQNTFGDQFSMTWMSGELDENEFETLFAYAAKLNLTGVWLYSYCKINDDSVIEKFCEAAVKAGFMEVYYE